MTAPARHFDILVIGAGPAGLSAAHVAAKSGVSVGIVDDNPLPGGQIWRQGPRHPPAGEARALLDDLARRSNVTLCNGTRSEEHTSELQSLMRISYAVFCLKKKRTN